MLKYLFCTWHSLRVHRYVYHLWLLWISIISSWAHISRKAHTSIYFTDFFAKHLLFLSMSWLTFLKTLRRGIDMTFWGQMFLKLRRYVHSAVLFSQAPLQFYLLCLHLLDHAHSALWLEWCVCVCVLTVLQFGGTVAVFHLYLTQARHTAGRCAWQSFLIKVNVKQMQ